MEARNMWMTYRESGETRQPVLLLIHGFPFDSGMWEAQLSGLEQRAHVIAPDLRGHGRSPAALEPYSFEQHADDLGALLDRLGVAKAVVGGLSMGGYAALAFWRRYPERVAGLALMDTRASADSPEVMANRLVTAEKVRQQGVQVLADEMLPRMLSPEKLVDERVAGALREMILRQPADGMISSLMAMRSRPDSTTTLGTITVHAVVIAGEHDVITPPEVAAAMAKEIPEARSIVIVHAGHMTPVENPIEVNQALEEELSLAKW